MERRQAPLRIALYYALFGTLWILGSDYLVTTLAPSPGEAATWQTAKGWLFVVASAGVIYWLVRREIRKRGPLRDLFRTALHAVPDPMALTHLESGEVVAANEGFVAYFGDGPEAVVGKTTLDLGLWTDPGDRDEFRARLEEEGRVVNERTMMTTVEGRAVPVLFSSRAIELEGEPYIVSVAREISELEATRRRLEAQVRRLDALRDIDLAITGSMDLRLTMDVILRQVRAQLELDAAAILLVEPGLEVLRFGAREGFRTDALRHTELQFGEGHAGRAAATRGVVEVEDLREDPRAFAGSETFGEEGFVYYAAAPLVTKGEVNGVLEVFHRAPREPGESWHDFLGMIAAQAAIAVENAELLQSVRDRNRELRQAYDATIEGWSKALELRDDETQGHTERVTEVTLKLARRMGIDGEELVHVRRGALLHDIGKIAIPDSILNKPGPLNDEQWERMREHPEIAQNLLAPIEFLRPATAIPYCHHEWWDGTGYPRSLEGEEIPLAARVFAVVDVWDALRSDRPYRQAWPADEVIEHIREESGTHFDPQVVEAFLELHEEADLDARRPGRAV